MWYMGIRADPRPVLQAKWPSDLDLVRPKMKYAKMAM